MMKQIDSQPTKLWYWILTLTGNVEQGVHNASLSSTYKHSQIRKWVIVWTCGGCFRKRFLHFKLLKAILNQPKKAFKIKSSLLDACIKTWNDPTQFLSTSFNISQIFFGDTWIWRACSKAWHWVHLKHNWNFALYKITTTGICIMW
jgi:hypothetical protein